MYKNHEEGWWYFADLYLERHLSYFPGNVAQNHLKRNFLIQYAEIFDMNEIKWAFVPSM